MKKRMALLLAVVMCVSLCSCGKSEAATNCEELILKIGSVTFDSGEEIEAAEAAYEALSDKEKAQIASVADTLFDSREEYDEICAEVAEQEAAAAALEAEAAAKAENEAKANEVIALIDGIGTISLDSEAAIKAARELYDTLSADAQALVTNYSVLESAENEFSVLQSAEKEKIVSEYTSKFEVEEDRVEGITWYMHNDMPDYIDTRSYIIPYIGVQGENVWICIRYNYTADNWVFWEKLSIVTDNEKYIKTVGAFDTVRDNDGGEVWEWYDECLYYNQELDSEELLMLKDIAESGETIIRFEGDEYYDDLYVTDTDKKIISDVLMLYSGLLK